MECEICQRDGGIPNAISALGTTPICFECYFENAEKPATLHNAALEARRTGRPIPHDIKRKITCWAGEDGYLPLRQWERRVSRQALVVFSPAEEIVIDGILAQMRQIADRRDRARSIVIAQKRKPSFARRFWDVITFSGMRREAV